MIHVYVTEDGATRRFEFHNAERVEDNSDSWVGEFNLAGTDGFLEDLQDGAITVHEED